MRLSTWYHSCGIGLVLMLLVLGCSNQGGGTSGNMTEVRVRVGQILQQSQTRQGAPSFGHAALAQSQRAAGLPSDITQLLLHVTHNTQEIPGSPWSIPLDTAEVRLALRPGRTYQLSVEALNQRHMVVLRGETQLQIVAQSSMEVAVPLVTQETVILAAMQAVQATTGGDVVVTDPQSPVQGLRITIPPAALPQNTTVLVMEVSNPQGIPAPPRAAGQIVELMANGVTFLQPVVVTFPYDAALVGALGLDETTLRLWRYNTSAGQWAPVPQQQLDTTRRVLVAQLTSFSLYAVSGPPDVSASNRQPVADAQTRTTLEDTALAVVLTGSDPDNQPLSFRLLTTPGQGTLTGTPPNLLYTPAPGFHGQSSFTFVVHDGLVDSVPGMVTLNVLAVNDPPVVATPFMDVQVQAADTETGRALDLYTIFTDADLGAGLDTLQFAVVHNASPALVEARVDGSSLRLTYTPQTNGVARLTVRATDSAGHSADATLTITLDRTYAFRLNVSRLNDVSQLLQRAE